MGLNNGILTQPISLEDIAQCFGVSTEDLGTLCSYSDINMWAKYKPLRHGYEGVLTDAQRALGGYGILATKYNVDNSSSRESAINNAIAGNTGWRHDKPRGENYSEWYRELDFDGYNHNSICPFYLEDASLVEELRVMVGQRVNLPVNNMLVTDITGIIGLDDASKSGYGFIVKRGSTIIHIDAINSAGTDVNWPLNQNHTISLVYAAGTYQVCGYIRDYNRGNAVLLPCSVLTIDVDKEQDIVILSVTLSASGAKTVASLTITGNRKSPVVPAGTATLRIYNTSGKEIESHNYRVDQLSYGQSYSKSDRYELQYTTIGSYSLSYQGVTITKQV